MADESLTDFLNRDWQTFSSLDGRYYFMSRFTGLPIGEYESMVQDIVTALSTPKGSCGLMREFGCDLPRMVDQPINGIFLSKAYNAVADAINRWVPLFKLEHTELNQLGDSSFEVVLHGESLIDGQRVSIGEIILDTRALPIVQLRTA